MKNKPKIIIYEDHSSSMSNEAFLAFKTFIEEVTEIEFDELYQGYEEWLDQVEPTLPIQQEEPNGAKSTNSTDN